VCASGCDFTSIQAAINDPGIGADAIIEVQDPVHTEAGIVFPEGIGVTIRGLGAEETIVQAHETLEESPERVFLIEEGAVVALEKMTIRHGRPSVEDEHGGGIDNHGTLVIRSCVVTRNTAGGGGGICNWGDLAIVNSAVSDNAAFEHWPATRACGSGGGIRSGRGTLAVVNSTLSGNQAGEASHGTGGAVRVGCKCTAVFTNTTISGNKAANNSGGIHVAGTLRLVNCTISNNATPGEAGGVYVKGTLDMVNTIIAGNSSGTGECVVAGMDEYGISGTLGTQANNLIQDGTCDADYSGDPMLSHLDDNGGDTLTHALLLGSPAIDAIPVVSCTLPTDQRGGVRPIVQVSPDTPCDVGAFEVQAGQ
jgi:hypothetical protein